jgi:signal transduction histidine kinase
MSNSKEATHKNLKAQLQEALEQDPVDYGRVIALSSALGGEDPNFVRFTVDAGHISRLGRELVSRQETAVAELVKNAYDADATNVELRFADADRAGGRLEITDDGNGMSRVDLIQGFMRLSSTIKIHTPTSPRFGRQRAGRKGIGRFAAQRLGDTLTITTQTVGDETALQVRIDWNLFSSDRELASIGSTIRQIPKQREHGTTLLIEGLREHWPDGSIRKASRHVLDLLQPFPLAEASDSQRPSALPIDLGFAVTFKRSVGGRDFIIADEQRLLFDHALAVIDGVVDEGGRAEWTVTSRRLRISDPPHPIGPEREGAALPFTSLRNVRFRAHYFVLEAGTVPSGSMAGIRAALRANGGVRLYRNGFRVLPYGDKGDDWLGLNESYRQRLLLPPHGNDNFFGFVEISDPIGAIFEETSSREGLLNNEAFAELTDFVSRALKSAVIRVSEARGVKVSASQKGWAPIAPTTADKIRSVAQELSDAAKRQTSSGAAGSGASQAELESLAQGLQDVASAHEAEARALLQELGMLRVLASLGLTIGEFTHEIRQYLPAVQADTDYFEKLHANSGEHLGVARRLHKNFTALRTYASYFDRAVSDNATRQLRAIEIRDVINAFADTIAPTLERSSIVLTPVRIEGYRLFTTPMHLSEWTSILFNLFTNSRKAIRRRGVPGQLAIHAGRSDERIFVEFADNGDGIPQENRERIFNAFFTTASPAPRRAGDQEDVLGTGLGLKIVHDIVTAYGGTVALVTPPNGFATCFRVEVPEAERSQVGESDY